MPGFEKITKRRRGLHSGLAGEDDFGSPLCLPFPAVKGSHRSADLTTSGQPFVHHCSGRGQGEGFVGEGAADQYKIHRLSFRQGADLGKPGLRS